MWPQETMRVVLQSSRIEPSVVEPEMILDERRLQVRCKRVANRRDVSVDPFGHQSRVSRMLKNAWKQASLLA
jgi:hypothetical protein